MKESTVQTKHIKSIADNVKAERLRCGVSAKAAASTLGVTYQHYWKIENGQVDIKTSHLIKLCALLKTSLHNFFNGVL